MRRIVIIVIIALVASGLGMTFHQPLDFSEGWRKILSLVHIWGGVFFIVVFSLYAWDHITAHRNLLGSPSPVTISGFIQTLSATIIILTGVVLFLYGTQAWPTLRGFHYWLTYLMAASIIFHYLSPKP